MKKPNDFDQIKPFGEFTPLELGGHICVIKKVEETISRSGRAMLIVYLDTDSSDAQPNYFSDQWKADDRDGKKWGCRVFQTIFELDGKTSRGFKTFISCVEKSNPRFSVSWDDNFATCFVGKKIGGVFGREQYKNASGDLKWSTKCVSFRSVEAVESGVPVPADKYLPSEDSDFGISDSYGETISARNNQIRQRTENNGYSDSFEYEDLPF